MLNLSTMRIPNFDTVKSCLIYKSGAFLILPLSVYVLFILIFVILSLVFSGIHVIFLYYYLMITEQK